MFPSDSIFKSPISNGTKEPAKGGSVAITAGFRNLMQVRVEWLWKRRRFNIIITIATTGGSHDVLCELFFRTDPKQGGRPLGSWSKPGFHICPSEQAQRWLGNMTKQEWTCQETQGRSGLHTPYRSNSALDKSLSREDGHRARSIYLFSISFLHLLAGCMCVCVGGESHKQTRTSDIGCC